MGTNVIFNLTGVRMIYKIEHGSIAAVQFVTMPNGKKITVSDSKDERNLRYLPLEVKEIINRQFGIVFSLPYDSREEFIQNSIPFEIDVFQTCICGCNTPKDQWEINYSGYSECPECRMV
jgi:hypothetical protein